MQRYRWLLGGCSLALIWLAGCHQYRTEYLGVDITEPFIKEKQVFLIRPVGDEFIVYIPPSICKETIGKPPKDIDGKPYFKLPKRTDGALACTVLKQTYEPGKDSKKIEFYLQPIPKDGPPRRPVKRSARVGKCDNCSS